MENLLVIGFWVEMVSSFLPWRLLVSLKHYFAVNVELQNSTMGVHSLIRKVKKFDEAEIWSFEEPSSYFSMSNVSAIVIRLK